MTTADHPSDSDDVDAVFADIVSRWDEPTAPGSGEPDADEGRFGASRALRPHVPPDQDDPTFDASVFATDDSGQGPDANRPPRRDMAKGSTTGRDDEERVDAGLDHDDEDGASPTDASGATTGGHTSGWRSYELADEPEEDFIPPPPAPLPRGDLTFWVALVCLVVGPLWLLWVVLVHPYDGHLPMVLSVGTTVAGFAALVSRSPRRRGDDDEDGDDGAVV